MGEHSERKVGGWCNHSLHAPSIMRAAIDWGIDWGQQGIDGWIDGWID